MSLDGMVQEDLCFVIMPFGKHGEYGPDGREGEQISCRVYSTIKSGVEEAGKELDRKLRCERAGETRKGYIDTGIYRSLDQAKIVIADLTGNNPNVYYELGVRLAVEERGTIVVTQDRSKIPFDMKHYYAEEYALDDLQGLKELVTDRVKDYHKSEELGEIGSPVFIFVPERIPARLDKAIKHFWSPFTSPGVHTDIMLGQLNLELGERTGIMGTGDGLALGKVTAMLNLLRVEFRIVLSPHSPSWENNLIFIGGTGTNKPLRRVIERLRPNLRFRSEASLPRGFHECIIYNKSNNQIYRPKRDKDNPNILVEDLGWILYARNPHDNTRRVLVLAGTWGAGSDAAARTVVGEPSIVKEILELDSAEAVVRAPVEDNQAGKPTKEYLARLL